jgi:general secretion pathway protein N
MKRWHLCAGGIVAYLLILVAGAPATLVDALLRRASDGALRLAEARGTVWSGAGHLEILDAGRNAGVGRNLAWRLSPLSLLRGHLVCEMNLEAGARPFAVTIFPARIELADADIRVPAAIVGLAVPKLAALGLGGELLVHVTDLAIARGGVQGNATVLWRGASSVHIPATALGDYELRYATSGNTVTAALRTLEGPLQLDGAGSWAIGASPAFGVAARVAPPQRAQLEPLLRMVAVERSPGNFELQYK